MAPDDGLPGTLHDDAVAVLSAYAPDGPRQRAAREDYLAFLAAHADAMSRGCSAGHLTASALVIDPAAGRVLLTLHAKLGRWLQMGGHCEPGDTSLAVAAAREAAEESGIDGLTLLPAPVRLDRHLMPACRDEGGALRALDHLDVQYVAIAREGAREQMSEESLDLRWFGWDDVPTDDASVLALVAAARGGLATS
jgi:8-oxo-dGTP pyrophosphatase MutT (NUDIX family)